MGAADRRKIRNLLNKGTLTGFETAKIVMSQIYELEKIAEPELHGFLQEKLQEALCLTIEEIDALKDRNLKGRTDRIVEYNNWLGAISSVHSLIYCAHVYYLKIHNLLCSPILLLERYLTEAIAKFDRMQVPDIVTEKQYQDLKVAQRKQMLDEEHELGWVLYWRAERIAQKDFGERSMEILLEDYPDRAIDAYHQACSEVCSLLKRGKLTLIHREAVICTLEAILNTKTDKEILALIYPTFSSQARIRSGKLEPLVRHKIRVKDLYESHLPEWVEHVDEYKHNYGKSAPYDVAVIQNPTRDMIDEKGYYRKKQSTADHREINDRTVRTLFTGQFPTIKYYISLFLFRKSLLKAVSESTGIYFCDQVDRWYEEIKSALSRYEEIMNNALLISDGSKKPSGRIPETVNLEELQISSTLEERFRDRLSKPLETDKWVSECHLYFIEEMKEKMVTGMEDSSGYR
jgi:hypothetical protein